MNGERWFTPEITIVHPAPEGEDVDLLERSEWITHAPYMNKAKAVAWVKAELPKYSHAISGRVLKTIEGNHDFEEEVFYLEA